jgi:hypothetical protein
MRWTNWRRHFEVNATRPEPRVEAPCGLTALEHRALLSSLQKFQLGEAGEGRIAHEIDAVQLPDVDDDFRQALKAFVREEGRHARVLGAMVRALGGRLLQQQWTQRAFVRGRRLLGVRFKLLVLLAGEGIAIVFYAQLASRLRERGGVSFADALDEFGRDEAHHLRFQADFFQSRAPGTWVRALLRLCWWPLISLAVALVLLDQRQTFNAFGLKRGEVVRAFLPVARQGAACLRVSRAR